MNNYTKGGGRKFQDWSGLVWVGEGDGTWRVLGGGRRMRGSEIRSRGPGRREILLSVVAWALLRGRGVVGENRGLRSEADDQSLWLGKRRITLAFTNTAHTST